MPTLEHGTARIYYEEYGRGFPVLLFAPGGMRSSIALWSRSPWNPIERLADRYRVIAMDQRNAGRSTAPITAHDGWQSYVEDQVALLDALGIARTHVIGGCIGGSYCLGIVRAAPDRIASAVLQQPIGFDGTNREAFFAMFDSWADELKAKRHDVDASAWRAFRDRMYGGDFVFNVDRAFVRTCTTPMLVLLGNDQYHPSVTSREIVALAPNAELVERWKEPDAIEHTVEHVRSFLARHTPGQEAQ